MKNVESMFPYHVTGPGVEAGNPLLLRNLTARPSHHIDPAVKHDRGGSAHEIRFPDQVFPFHRPFRDELGLGRNTVLIQPPPAWPI